MRDSILFGLMPTIAEGLADKILQSTSPSFSLPPGCCVASWSNKFYWIIHLFWSLLAHYHGIISTNDSNTNHNGSNDNANLPPWYTFEGVPGLTCMPYQIVHNWLWEMCLVILSEQHDTLSLVSTYDISSLWEVLREMPLEQAERTIPTWCPKQKTEPFHLLGYVQHMT